MFGRGVSAIFAAAFIFAVVAIPAILPADAADDIETKAQVCSACHGQNGVPTSATIPVIWGQQQNYLVKQLHDYRSGDRNSPVMSPLAQGIQQDDTRKIAAYFAAKSWPARPAAAASAAPPSVIAVSYTHLPKQNEIAVRVLKEIRERLKFLVDVGLEYLTLARASGKMCIRDSPQP